MATVRFDSLVRRLAELAQNLGLDSLDDGVSPAAQDVLRGYRVLSHAELEACLEDLGRECARRAVADWRHDPRPRRVIIGLIAAYRSPGILEFWGGTTRRGLGPLRLVDSSSASVDDAIASALDSYVNKIGGNHGIQANNIRAILGPLGVPESELEEAWLAHMDTLGHLRGRTAHSSADRLETLLSPSDEIARVNTAVLGLRRVDNLLRRLAPA